MPSEMSRGNRLPPGIEQHEREVVARRVHGQAQPTIRVIGDVPYASNIAPAASIQVQLRKDQQMRVAFDKADEPT